MIIHNDLLKKYHLRFSFSQYVIQDLRTLTRQKMSPRCSNDFIATVHRALSFPEEFHGKSWRGFRESIYSAVERARDPFVASKNFFRRTSVGRRKSKMYRGNLAIGRSFIFALCATRLMKPRSLLKLTPVCLPLPVKIALCA